MNPAFQSCNRWLETVLGFLYPETCQICRLERAGREEGFVCNHCQRKAHLIQPPFCERCGLPYPGDITTAFECGNCREMDLHFKSARSAVIAGGVILDVIHRYKYKGELWFEPFLADLLVRQAAPALARGKWDMIVPVPLHPAKQRERGFNQAARLANRLSRAVKIPLNSGLLKRVQPTRTQTLLSRPQRAANVNRAFAPRSAQKLRGARIVLVDDVFTTGATTSACARILRSAGAGDVCVWTVARGL